MQYAKRLRKVVIEPAASITKAANKICVGIDPSLNGHAIAVLRDGWPDFLHGWTTKKGLQKRQSQWLSYLKVPSGRSESNSQYRMKVLIDWTLSVICDYAFKVPGCKIVVAIEGYAFSKRSRGLHEIHGLVEAIKQGLWDKEIPFRIYDPLSVKLAATGDGKAEKADMQQACFSKYGIKFSAENDPGGNLADALLLASLLYTEIAVRDGVVKLDQLNPDLRSVLLRTTNNEPLAPISRPFASTKEAEVDLFFGEASRPLWLPHLSKRFVDFCLTDQFFNSR